MVYPYLVRLDGGPVTVDEVRAVLKSGMTNKEAVQAIRVCFTPSQTALLDTEAAIASLKHIIKECVAAAPAGSS